jgi:hypothetical protein
MNGPSTTTSLNLNGVSIYGVTSSPEFFIFFISLGTLFKSNRSEIVLSDLNILN